MVNIFIDSNFASSRYADKCLEGSLLASPQTPLHVMNIYVLSSTSDKCLLFMQSLLRGLEI